MSKCLSSSQRASRECKQATDDSAALLPSEITVRPITMGQITAVLALLRPVIPLPEQGGDWMALAAAFGDDFNRALPTIIGATARINRPAAAQAARPAAGACVSRQ